jgi:hypothetical protein
VAGQALDNLSGMRFGGGFANQMKGIPMANQHTIEIFTAGCPACDDVIQLVNQIARPGSQIQVLDMHDATIAARAKALGIRRVPSVVIDGKLASCCATAGVDEGVLRSELG